MSRFELGLPYVHVLMLAGGLGSRVLPCHEDQSEFGLRFDAFLTRS
jgi:hypothetical protein